MRLRLLMASALVVLAAGCAGPAAVVAEVETTRAPAGPSTSPPPAAAAPTIPLGTGLVGFPNDTDRWVYSHPTDSRTPRIRQALLGKPASLWLTGDESFGNLRDYVRRAARRDGTMVLTLWNIPQRDDGLSAASPLTLAQYRAWVARIASTIGRSRALVVLEPDALWFYDRLPSDAARAQRLTALRYAVSELRRAAPNARLYVEAGTASGSVTPQRMAALLHSVGVADYAVNVSSYAPAPRIAAYAQGIRAALQRLGATNPRYVVDTGRNGARVWDNTWCNPEQQRLGAAPGAVAAASGQDFRLWIKAPGTSDGDCGPAGAGKGSEGGQFLPAVAYRMIS